MCGKLKVAPAFFSPSCEIFMAGVAVVTSECKIYIYIYIYIHAAPRQGPPTPRSQGVISASVVVAPGQIFYATIIQKPCI